MTNMPPAKRARRSLDDQTAAMRQTVAESFEKEAFQASLLCEYATRTAPRISEDLSVPLTAEDASRIRHVMGRLRYANEIVF